MSLVMLTEPAAISVEGETVKVTLVSGNDEWAFCLTRHHFRLSVARASREIDAADCQQDTVVELRAAH